MLMKENISKINPYVRFVQKEELVESGVWTVPWRILYDYEIMFITYGNFRVKTSQGELLFKSGDLLLIPPFLRHKQEIPEGCKCSYYAVHLDLFSLETGQDFSVEEIYKHPCDNCDQESLIVPELFAREIYEPEGIDLSVIVQVKKPLFFLEMFQDLYEEFYKNRPTSPIRIKGYAIFLISALFEEILNDESMSYQQTAVNACADYLLRNFQEKIDFTTLIKQYGFSLNYFRTLFKQYLKCAPNEYLTNVRIEEAKKLLQLGYSNVNVAEMVGYNDVAYFSRLFKKHEGISPSKWKEINKKTEIENTSNE